MFSASGLCARTRGKLKSPPRHPIEGWRTRHEHLQLHEPSSIRVNMTLPTHPSEEFSSPNQDSVAESMLPPIRVNGNGVFGIQTSPPVTALLELNKGWRARSAAARG